MSFKPPFLCNCFSVNHSQSLRTRSHEGLPSDRCTLEGVVFLPIPGEDLEEDFKYECAGSNGVGGPLIMNKEQRISLDAMVGSGAVELGVDQIDIYGAQKSGNKIILPNGSINTRKADGGTRKLTSVTGKKPVLAVKVIDKNGLQRREDLATISQEIFGGSDDVVNLKSQLFGCSFGALEVTTDYSDFATDLQMQKIKQYVTDAAPGVMEVTIDVDITKTDMSTIHTAVTDKVQTLLELSLPAGPFEHVIWAAFAFVNHWLTVYQEDNYNKPGVQLHELGHNFGLGHSGGLDGQEYTDHTCFMGASSTLFSDEHGKMCFNPAKNWQLDWYGGKGAISQHKISIDPFQTENSSFQLVGIGEYDKNTANHPVVVKIETGTTIDIFIGFNRAVGPNAYNDEADDEITIIETGNNGESFSQSYLKAHLLTGETYTYNNFASSGKILKITADSIDLTANPGVATITIALTIPTFENVIWNGNWGDWWPSKSAGPDYWACGAQLRVEGSQAGGDDTAANGIKMMFCKSVDWSKQDTVSIHDGIWGDWSSMVMCPEGYYIDGAQVRFEDYCGNCDDTALNGLRISCRSRENKSKKQWLTVHEGWWGEWKPDSFDPDHFVTAVSVRFEANQQSGDDTALNGLKFTYDDSSTCINGDSFDAGYGPYSSGVLAEDACVECGKCSVPSKQPRFGGHSVALESMQFPGSYLDAGGD
eukprot:6706686-Ditylum_brightwellii.AAC.1